MPPTYSMWSPVSTMRRTGKPERLDRFGERLVLRRHAQRVDDRRPVRVEHHAGVRVTGRRCVVQPRVHPGREQLEHARTLQTRPHFGSKRTVVRMSASDRWRITPRTKVDLGDFEPDSTDGAPGGKEETQARHHGVARAAGRAAGPVVGGAHPVAPRRPPGHGRGRQGRHRQEGVLRREPDGRPRGRRSRPRTTPSWPTTSSGGSSGSSPSGVTSASSTARTTRTC